MDSSAWEGVASRASEVRGGDERWAERNGNGGVEGGCVCLFINHLD